ncbi:hypothetical protein LOTGIDRAFT_158441 [Lottia gigantea]|uniref:Uncharacterized protein n=1 Tax=Lottia gigantea TaxID=225164 RepID=V4CBY3_LOTGI|nr:hypothetical protein LOTGIDRAFT_158441 [Lottia gigantea]ESO99354.1 hypothetical protein LOTGIDRAFT_158441 [Lottia gigantea]
MLNGYILIFTALGIGSINALLSYTNGTVNDTTTREGQPEDIDDIRPQIGIQLGASSGKVQTESRFQNSRTQPRKKVNAFRTKTNRKYTYNNQPNYFYNNYRGNYRTNNERVLYEPDYATNNRLHDGLYPYQNGKVNKIGATRNTNTLSNRHSKDVIMSSTVKQSVGTEGSTVAPSSESNLLMYMVVAAGSFVGLALFFAFLMKLRSRSKKHAEKRKTYGKQIDIQYSKEISFTTGGGFKCQNSLKANSLKLEVSRAEHKRSLPPLPPIPLLPGQIKMQEKSDYGFPTEETFK